MRKLYILDASAYLFRAYYAIRNMTNSEGKSTNALYGFISSYLKILKDFSPEELVVVFDGPKSWQSRLDIYPAYKANRKECPEDLSYQIGWAREFCELAQAPFLNLPGIEADDTIGAVAKWAAAEGKEVFICSEDKDLCQLVTDKVQMLHTRKENALLGPAEVEEKFGVPPSQIIDYLAIVGDASDNVPGLSGFGPKSAATLLQKYGSVAKLLEHTEDFSGKKRATLETEKEKLLLSQKLVTVDTEVEIPKQSAFYKLPKIPAEALKPFFQEKQFHRFLKEVAAEEPQEPEELRYTLIETEEQLKKLLEKLQLEKEICFDTETTSLVQMEAELVGIGFGHEEGVAYYVPTRGNNFLQLLKPLFENPGIGFYGHNVKYDAHVLKNAGISIAHISFDTLLASYTLHAQQRQHSLEALALEHFGKNMTPIEELIGKGKKQICMSEVPAAKVSDYCCEDVDYTFRLKQIFAAGLKERGLEKLFYELELPLLSLLLEMERTGIYLDTQALTLFSKEVQEALEKEKTTIEELAGESFNLNSPKQVGEVLFDKLGLPAPKKTKTGYSTSADVLQMLAVDHPIASHLLTYRTYEKLRSTYVEALPKQIYEGTGRIHCTFHQSVAATGRLSSSDPNLQNIPIKTELGREIRRCFKPQKSGHSYLALDYSQIELRLLAHFSEDKDLIHAFQKGEDIHRATAAKLAGIHEEFVTKEMRSSAKAVNFGILYGQGKFGLSQVLGISQKEAASFIKRYFERYGSVKEYIDRCVEEAKKTGRSVTLTGRERPLGDINSKQPMLRKAAERLAVNTPLQGTAADLIKLAMLEVEKRGFGRYLVLQIHDELLFEVPNDKIDELQASVKEAMESVWELKVPLVVDVAVGNNWAEC